VPADTPTTLPLVDPTVATEVLLLVHVPPEVRSVSVLEDPTQTLVVPAMAAGSAFTVTGAVTKPVQPDDKTL
jgi:hypothetical protein